MFICGRQRHRIRRIHGLDGIHIAILCRKTIGVFPQIPSKWLHHTPFNKMLCTGQRCHGISSVSFKGDLISWRSLHQSGVKHIHIPILLCHRGNLCISPIRTSRRIHLQSTPGRPPLGIQRNNALAHFCPGVLNMAVCLCQIPYLFSVLIRCPGSVCPGIPLHKFISHTGILVPGQMGDRCHRHTLIFRCIVIHMGTRHHMSAIHSLTVRMIDHFVLVPGNGLTHMAFQSCALLQVPAMGTEIIVAHTHPQIQIVNRCCRFPAHIDEHVRQGSPTICTIGSPSGIIIFPALLPSKRKTMPVCSRFRIIVVDTMSGLQCHHPLPHRKCTCFLGPIDVFPPAKATQGGGNPCLHSRSFLIPGISSSLPPGSPCFSIGSK